MKDFVIYFDHTCVSTYKTIIEAESKEEALSIFEENPFENCTLLDEQGLTIDNVDINEQ